MSPAKSVAEVGHLAQILLWLDAAERRLVRRVVIQSRHPWLRALIVLSSHASNGWLYPSLAAFLFVVQGTAALRVIFAAGTAAGVAYCVYPFIKRVVGRIRPCETDPSLDPPVKALDRYSCPSGHCMAATTVAVTLAWEYPASVPSISLGWLVIAWSRVSSGHHYPSDLIAGQRWVPQRSCPWRSSFFTDVSIPGRTKGPRHDARRACAQRGRVVTPSNTLAARATAATLGPRRRSRMAPRNVRKSSSGGPVRNAITS